MSRHPDIKIEAYVKLEEHLRLEDYKELLKILRDHAVHPNTSPDSRQKTKRLLKILTMPTEA